MGSRAYVRGGVRIGQGAIVGTQTVVTKDVESYSVVVGNTGVVKRKRFDDRIIERLLQLQWWNYDFAHFGGVDVSEIHAALDILEAKIAESALTPFEAFIISDQFIELAVEPPLEPGAG